MKKFLFFSIIMLNSSFTTASVEVDDLIVSDNKSKQPHFLETGDSEVNNCSVQ